MQHLDDSTAIAAAEGNAPSEVLEHVSACPRCQREVDSYARLLASLRVEGEPGGGPPEHLLHWARAYARTAHPAPSRPRVLELIALGAEPLTAVRGGAEAGRAMLFAGPDHQLDLRVEPTAAGRVRLHGQVVPLSGEATHPWRVGVVTRDGQILRAISDDAGEFTIDDVAASSGLSLVAESGGQRLIVPRLGRSEEARRSS